MKGRQSIVGASMSALSLIALTLLVAGCGTVGSSLNPFEPDYPPEAFYGEANDHALNDSKVSVDGARQALEAMASYRRAQAPQPANPVMQPAVVRLMWVPDHLNSHGDLVPAHYYYLKVLNERWAVSDAFELEQQLGSTTDAGSIPYVVGPNH